MRPFSRWWVWALLGVALLLVPWPAAVADAVYLGAVLPAWSVVTAALVSAVPLSLSAGLLLFGLAALVAALLWPGGAASAGQALGWALAVLLLTFPLAFGLGYRTTPIAPVGEAAAPAAYAAAREAVLTRLLVTAGPGRAALAAGAPDAAVLSGCVADVAARLRDAPSPTLPTRVKALPPGALLTFGFSGVVSPWLLEPHLDPGLPPATATAVALHELAHTAGFARESEAEAVALLAGLGCEDPAAAYAAALAAASRLARRLPAEERQAYVASWPEGAVEDLAAAAAAAASYRSGALAAAVERAYDAYLVSLGTEGGMADYDRSTDALVRLLDLALPAPSAGDGVARGRHAVGGGSQVAADEGGDVGVAPHEAPEQHLGVVAVAGLEDGAGEVPARALVEDALGLEAAEGVGVEHLGPLVGVVAGGVAAGEHVREGRHAARQRELRAYGEGLHDPLRHGHGVLV